jgi:putative nucleotidyltransferase with HDIG domain
MMYAAGPSIMLVDDEPALLEVCAEALADLAFRIVTASNGLEAAALLEKEPFDLIVSDLRMPGFGGMDLIKTANRIAPGTDIIVLTGYGTIENAVDCVKLGATNYLLKPFQIEHLRSVVAKTLDERVLRNQQKAVSRLSRMLDFSNALSGVRDTKSLIKEFLSQARATFLPDGIAFFHSGNGHGAQHLHIGPYFRSHPETRSSFEALTASLATKKTPILFDTPLLRQALGLQEENETLPATAIGVCMSSSDKAPGALIVLRSEGAQPYSLSDLQLLTLFADHASLCFESHWAWARLKSLNDEIVFSLVHAVEAKDTYTRGHSERVSNYAAKLAAFLGLSQQDIDLVRTAGVLHDVGKIGVPDNILNKPTSLDLHEMGLMQQHPSIAITILNDVKSLTQVLPIVYHHHEHLDGSGYPDGLRGDDIPFLARLVSVVDGFEAMTSERAYHKARSLEEAKRILTDGSGQQWDAGLVQAWFNLLDQQGLPTL